MNFYEEKKTSLLPVEIGYYGRPVSRLSREELINAVVELTRMYMELERKLKTISAQSQKAKNV